MAAAGATSDKGGGVREVVGLSGGLDLVRRADLDELSMLHQKMQAIVTTMPGFISVKMFTAEDGEVLALAEFASLDSLTAWKEHPEHVVAQQRGREEFFAMQLCPLTHTALLQRPSP
jgi:heme-degrading monooxygenase HmoA